MSTKLQDSAELRTTEAGSVVGTDSWQRLVGCFNVEPGGLRRAEDLEPGTVDVLAQLVDIGLQCKERGTDLTVEGPLRAEAINLLRAIEKVRNREEWELTRDYGPAFRLAISVNRAGEPQGTEITVNELRPVRAVAPIMTSLLRQFVTVFGPLYKQFADQIREKLFVRLPGLEGASTIRMVLAD